MPPKTPWFPLYAQDFLADTQGWSNLEVGVYARLLLLEWVNKGLPPDERRLRRMAHADPEEWNEAWPQVQTKFQLNGDGRLYNRRLEEERTKANRLQKQRQKAGKASAEARRNKLKDEENSTGVEDVLGGRSYSVDIQSQSQSQETPSLSLEPSPGGEGSASRAPPCPYSKIIGLYNEHCTQMPECRAITDKRKKQIQKCWALRSTLEAWEAFFKYANGLPFMLGKRNGPEHPNWRASIDFLTRPDVFVKTLEGQYE